MALPLIELDASAWNCIDWRDWFEHFAIDHVPADDALTFGVCDYGGPFVAAIARGRCVATQFHPEKSQAAGLRLYRNFVDGCRGAV